MGNAMHDTDTTTNKNLGPCPKCPSSDAFGIDEKGWGHCFSCGCNVHPKALGDEDAPKGTTEASMVPSDLLSGSFIAIPARGLTKDTCKKWGVQYVTSRSGQKSLAFPYYSDKKRMVAQKLRTEDKKFQFIGKTKDPQLFGQHLWSGGKMIVITEGEIDAMSVSQIQNHKWPVVSLPNGASSARRAITANLRWLEENFKEIILMFDMDDAGRKAAEDVVGLFSPGKCKVATLPAKDANECLLEGKSAEVIQAIWNATVYRPDGIVTVAEVIPKLDVKPTMGRELPWPGLTKLTYGLKDPAVWIWTSGSGMGKTEFFKSMAAHLLIKDPEVKIGMILLEEETQDTVVDMAGKMVGKCFNSPDVPFKEKERNEAVAKLNETNRLYLYDHFGHDDYDAIRAVIRHMVAGFGCNVIFLDHITAFTDGMGHEANSLAERMMKELASMTRELKFNLQLISHVRKSDSSRKPTEEGGRVKIDDMKGSGAIKQWANMIIGLERNQQATDEQEAHTTTVRILKGRGVGKNVGKTSKVRYYPKTAQLLEVDCEDTHGSGEDVTDFPF